jgi:hypothetical protein
MEIGSPSGVRTSNKKMAVKRRAITPLIIVELWMEMRLLSLLSITYGRVIALDGRPGKRPDIFMRPLR